MNRRSYDNRLNKGPLCCGQIRLILAVVLFAPLALSGFGQQTNAVVPAKESPAAEIKTLDGTTYQSVRILKVEPDGLVVEYKPQAGGVGLSKLKFENLSADVQQKHGYDAERGAAFQSQQAEGVRQWVAEMQTRQSQAWAAQRAREEDNFKAIREREKLDYERKKAEVDAEVRRQEAEARRREADQRAQTPAVQVNVQQNNQTPYYRSPYYYYYPSYSSPRVGNVIPTAPY